LYGCEDIQFLLTQPPKHQSSLSPFGQGRLPPIVAVTLIEWQAGWTIAPNHSDMPSKQRAAFQANLSNKFAKKLLE
jgi:hypothetical protein